MVGRRGGGLSVEIGNENGVPINTHSPTATESDSVAFRFILLIKLSFEFKFE